MATAFNEPKYQIEISDFQCHACRAEIACEKAYFSAVFFVEDAFRRKNYCVPCWLRSVAAAPSSSHPQIRDASGSSSDVFAFWKTKRPPKPSDKPQQLRFDAEVVLQFFRALADEPDGREGGGDQETAVARPTPVTEPNGDDAQDGPASLPEPSDASTDGAAPSIQSVPTRAEREELRFVLSLLLIRRKVLNFLSSRSNDGDEWLKLSEKADPRTVHWVRNPNLADSRLETIKDRIGELLNMRV